MLLPMNWVGLISVLSVSLWVQLCAAADKRDALSPFGVLSFLDWNHEWNDYQYDTPEKIERAAALMEQAGIGFVRQAISWDDVEPQQGQFDFSKYDAIFNTLEQHHIRTLGILCYTARWTGREWNAPPDPEHFAAYVRAVVQRYKSRIKYWELWNEPDQRLYWTQQDGMKGYVQLLKAVYPIIKEEDPTAVLVLGSVNTPFPLRDMYRQGAKDLFDVVNIHPFVTPLVPNAFGKLRGIYVSTRRVMEEFGDEAKPIWFTELGCPGVADTKTAPGWWEGPSPSEADQAAWVSAVYGEPLQWPGVQKVFWAFFQETNHFHNGIDYFGLLRRDYSQKPSYAAYRKAAKAWVPQPR